MPIVRYKIIAPKGRNCLEARFVDHTGKVVKAKKLKAKKRPQAHAEAQRIMKTLVPRSEDKEAVAYLDETWTPGSPFVKAREERGHTLTEAYIRNNRSAIDKVFGPYLKKLKLSQITPLIIEEAILDNVKRGTGRRLINSAIGAVKTAFKAWAKLRGIVNPLADIEKVKEYPIPRGALDLEEIGAILKAPSLRDRRFKAVVVTSMLTGMRLGEIRGLQQEDIDREKGVITVQHNLIGYKDKDVKLPKCGKVRRVPLPRPVTDLLDEMQELFPPQQCRFVFPNMRDTKEGAITAQACQAAFRAMLDAIGIDEKTRKERRLSFHSLRHSYISLLRAGGLSLSVSMLLAGHSSERVHDDYSHVIEFDQARAAIEAAVSGKVRE